MEFKIKSDYIELDNLLKVLNFVESGSEAKRLVQGGYVKVNGEPEARVRRKLKAGDKVSAAGKEVDVA